MIKLTVETRKHSLRKTKTKTTTDLKPTSAPPSQQPHPLTFKGTPRNHRITWPKNRFTFFSSSHHRWTWPSQKSDFNASGSDSSWLVDVSYDCHVSATSLHFTVLGTDACDLVTLTVPCWVSVLPCNGVDNVSTSRYQCKVYKNLGNPISYSYINKGTEFNPQDVTTLHVFSAWYAYGDSRKCQQIPPRVRSS